MNNDKLLRDQLKTMIEKANRSVASAKRQIDEGDYDFASSRAYYAAFYAMEAILLTRQLVFSKHSAVISAFNQYFIKTSIFSKEFSKLLTRLFRERQIGDYEFDLSIGKEEAKEDLKIAEKITSAITSYLIREGFIQSL
ncbi:MAG: HEPN domain-containing protein [bacterium]